MYTTWQDIFQLALLGHSISLQECDMFVTDDMFCTLNFILVELLAVHNCTSVVGLTWHSVYNYRGQKERSLSLIVIFYESLALSLLSVVIAFSFETRVFCSENYQQNFIACFQS